MDEEEQNVSDTFEQRHAETLENPLAEMRRRLQLWASAPDSRGQPLDAVIVPRKTVEDALNSIEDLIVAAYKRGCQWAMRNGAPVGSRDDMIDAAVACDVPPLANPAPSIQETLYNKAYWQVKAAVDHNTKALEPYVGKAARDYADRIMHEIKA